MSILPKVGYALVLTLFFGVLSLIPNIGYKAQTQVFHPRETRYEMVGSSEYLYSIIHYNCNASFNPLLFPITSLSGRGYVSGNFSKVYMPFYTYSMPKDAQPAETIRWGKQKDIEAEAQMQLVIDEFLINVPVLFVVFFITEFLNRRSLYFWFLGGLAGFVVGNLIGVLFGVFLGVFSTNLLFPKLRKIRLPKTPSITA